MSLGYLEQLWYVHEHKSVTLTLSLPAQLTVALANGVEHGIFAVLKPEADWNEHLINFRMLEALKFRKALGCLHVHPRGCQGCTASCLIGSAWRCGS
jgi:hypothetical protein